MEGPCNARHHAITHKCVVDLLDPSGQVINLLLDEGAQGVAPTGMPEPAATNEVATAEMAAVEKELAAQLKAQRAGAKAESASTPPAAPDEDAALDEAIARAEAEAAAKAARFAIIEEKRAAAAAAAAVQTRPTIDSPSQFSASMTPSCAASLASAWRRRRR